MGSVVYIFVIPANAKFQALTSAKQSLTDSSWITYLSSKFSSAGIYPLSAVQISGSTTTMSRGLYLSFNLAR